VNGGAVELGRAGDTPRIQEIRDYLRRHLIAEFLGQEDTRPPRTTELAREAKPAVGPAEAAGPARPSEKLTEV